MSLDEQRAMRWFIGLSKEDKSKAALKAGGRSPQKLAVYWRSLQPRS